MVARPESWPMGAAPARHILMPLYWAGLWLAVNIAPGRPREPAAKYSRSVEPRPASITSTPRLMTPSAKARESGTEDSRMSWAVTIAVAPLSPMTNSANAAPIARLTSSSHSSGTTPRTSYALMIDDRSGNAAHLALAETRTPGDTRCAPTLTARLARCWNGRPSGAPGPVQGTAASLPVVGRTGSFRGSFHEAWGEGRCSFRSGREGPGGDRG